MFRWAANRDAYIAHLHESNHDIRLLKEEVAELTGQKGSLELSFNTAMRSNKDLMVGYYALTDELIRCANKKRKPNIAGISIGFGIGALAFVLVDQLVIKAP